MAGCLQSASRRCRRTATLRRRAVRDLPVRARTPARCFTRRASSSCRSWSCAPSCSSSSTSSWRSSCRARGRSDYRNVPLSTIFTFLPLASSRPVREQRTILTGRHSERATRSSAARHCSLEDRSIRSMDSLRLRGVADVLVHSPTCNRPSRLALALVPVYLTYRVYQHYRYTKGLGESAEPDRQVKLTGFRLQTGGGSQRIPEPRRQHRRLHRAEPRGSSPESMLLFWHAVTSHWPGRRFPDRVRSLLDRRTAHPPADGGRCGGDGGRLADHARRGRRAGARPCRRRTSGTCRWRRRCTKRAGPSSTR